MPESTRAQLPTDAGRGGGEIETVTGILRWRWTPHVVVEVKPVLLPPVVEGAQADIEVVAERPPSRAEPFIEFEERSGQPRRSDEVSGHENDRITAETGSAGAGYIRVKVGRRHLCGWRQPECSPMLG